jgi:two-component system, sensor histidine kinase and response regulator
VVVNNGVEAVGAVERGSFDLVLMDVQMPEMDGFEATKQIRAREQTTGGHVPIIAVTAHAMKGDRERCLSAGMDSYLSKPIRAAELHQRIDEITAASGRSESPRPTSVAADDPWDWSTALATVQGSEELLREIIEAFLEEAPRQIVAMHEAIKRTDAALLRRAAHTVKGAVRYFGAQQAFDLAMRLETLASGGDLEAAIPAIDQLEREVERIKPLFASRLVSKAEAVF